MPRPMLDSYRVYHTENQEATGVVIHVIGTNCHSVSRIVKVDRGAKGFERGPKPPIGRLLAYDTLNSWMK